MIKSNTSDNVFDLLFQGISEGVLVVNENQIIAEVNNSVADMFGYLPNELKGLHLNTLIPTRVHAKHDHYFKEFIKRGESRKMGIGIDLYGIKKDGSKFPVEAGLNPFKVDKTNYVMTILSDITVRKEAEKEIKALNNQLEIKVESRTEELKKAIKQLKSSNEVLELEVAKRKKAEAKMKNALNKERELGELKTKFLSLVSHEFKTPLSGILTSATLIGKYEQAEQQARRDKHIKTIKNKVHYLTNILNDFLSIERLESGKVTYKFEEFSLQTLINEVIYNANVTLKSGQQIEYPNSIEDCLLRQDKNVMELVLSNLLSNAIKYSPEDSIINFKIEQTTEKLHFEVKDQGMGIPQKDQKHIFERYFRAENAINNQGTGIGLNIAKVHLENLGGKIYFTSEENQGTSFYVEIPKRHE